MSFSYPVLSEDEAQSERFSLLEDGIYNFKVIKSTGKMSRPKPGKESNPMIELQITVWDHKGHERYLYDYLVGSRNMAWKTRHFCQSTGLIKEYEEKKFNEFLAEGKSGKALIGFKAGTRKEDGTMYKDKNVIEDYVTSDYVAPTKPVDKTPHFDENDVPF